MRPAWRLATRTLSARRSRTLLLIGAVALSAALIAAVATAMRSVNDAVRDRLDATVGTADATIDPVSTGATFSASVLDQASSWPEVRAGVGRRHAAMGLSAGVQVLERQSDGSFAPATAMYASSVLIHAADDPRAYELRPLRLLAGRMPRETGEVVIDQLLAERLGWAHHNRDRARRAAEGRADRGFGVAGRMTRRDAEPAPPLPPRVTSEREAERVNLERRVRLDDEVQLVRGLFRRPMTLRVVGIAEQPPLGGRPQAYVTLGTLAEASGEADRYTSIDLVLREGVDAEAFAEARGAELPPTLILRTTSRVTSNVEQNLASSQLGFVLATVMAFLAAAFIITTGLTTDVTQRQRELSVLRCVGARKRQLVESQLWIGLLVGGAGALVGVPLGVGFAWLMTVVFAEQVPAGLVVPWWHLALAAFGSVVCGLGGAAWPAWRVAQLSPLEGLSLRGRAPRRGAVTWTLLAGLLGVAIMLGTVGLPSDGQTMFWGYATVGLPAMFVGYFLLGVPTVLLVAIAFGGVISRMLRLPPRVLRRTIEATPFRHGFTAGAMMAGLGLMVAIWTQGGAVLRDWIDQISFPDAFVSGLALTEESQRTLEALPFVTDTCAITLHFVETDAFGVRALQRYRTTFIAFEPEPFFRMTTLQWVQGDPAQAKRRLIEGGAVIVAREFLVAQGLGVGDTFRCVSRGETHEFEIVGVVTSPGLDIVSKFFNIGEEYTEQAVHAVFGSRADLKERFGSDQIQLIQIALAEDVDDREAVETIRETLFTAGVLDVGSGRAIKAEIRLFVGGSLLVFSAIAMVSMLVACFGVANLIVAGIEVRRFEFGVLRAVGAQRGLLTRLVLGEALVIALAACVLGTLMGVQGSWAGQRMYAALLGLLLELRPPPLPILVGWGIVIALTLGAAAPAILALGRRPTRELLAGDA